MVNNFSTLVERIKKDGKSLPGGILKVDSFINHQLDPVLYHAMAQEFNRRFDPATYNKILTIEASGIAPAIMLGLLTSKPVVFAKKKKPSTMSNMLVTEVFSFTKNTTYQICIASELNTTYQICIASEFLTSEDKVLFIDDFLANGKAAQGMLDLISQAGAQLTGMGFLIEKGFQAGGKLLRDQGIHVESLAIIDSLDNCTITFAQ